MAKLKITIEPLSFVALFLLIVFGWLEQVLFYVVALVLHEFSHYYVAKKLGYDFDNITFSPFGAVLNGNKNVFKTKDEVMVALAGPVCNLLLAVLCVAVWWMFPGTYTFTHSFVIANMALFVFNMLPLFPLDMGRVVVACIKNTRKTKVLFKIYIVNSIIFAILLLALFVVSAFGQVNITLLLVSILLISSIFDVKKDIYYQHAYVSKISSHYNSVTSVKEYIVPEDTKLLKLLKYINKNSYSIFLFVDKSGNILYKLNEKQLLDKCLDNGTGAKNWKK